MAERIRVALVYGGRSSEHSISVVSAGSVFAALDPQRYDVVTIGITAVGSWVRTDPQAAHFQITNRALPRVLTSDAEVAIVAVGSGLALLDSVDVVFPVLHGAFGEDGTVQGLLDMAGIPYVGSGVLASAVCMDKAFTKTVLAAAGLDVGRYVVARRADPPVDIETIRHLGLPLFVKPARAGSSVGISKVRSYDELPAALEHAFAHDRKVLIEEAVAGREIECGVLEDADGTITSSVPAEIRLHPDFDWYSFDAKYLEDACDFDIPAKLEDDVTAQIRAASETAFRAVECSGLARVDFFLTGSGRLVVNEINTMPGFTPISMFPRMFAESGVDYGALIDRLIATARVRER